MPQGKPNARIRRRRQHAQILLPESKQAGGPTINALARLMKRPAYFMDVLNEATHGKHLLLRDEVVRTYVKRLPLEKKVLLSVYFQETMDKRQSVGARNASLKKFLAFLEAIRETENMARRVCHRLPRGFELRKKIESTLIQAGFRKGDARFSSMVLLNELGKKLGDGKSPQRGISITDIHETFGYRLKIRFKDDKWQITFQLGGRGQE